MKETNYLKQKVTTPSIPKQTAVSKLQNKTRDDIFDAILMDNWRESIPTRVISFSPNSRRWISELKTRFITNPQLTPEKTEALIDLILWYESQLILNPPPTNVSHSRERDIKGLMQSIITQRTSYFLTTQIYTREVEKHIAQLEWNKILSHWYVADFLRDIYTLQALGLQAPQIREILMVIERYPDLQFDEAILEKYRNAVQSAINAYYWMDPKLQNSTLIKPDTDITVVPLKWQSGVPITVYKKGDTDSHARDFNLSLFPTSIIDAMSSFNRSVVYDLTRTTPPRMRARRFYQKDPKPDYVRITMAQDIRLKELLNIK